ncbi:MAG: hypothetical protein ACRDPY_41210 [Streptosporangiaceae bacterium]
MSVAGTYCRDMSRELRLLAAWPPGSPVRVGSVGRFLGDWIFEPETTLGSYGVDVSVDDDPGAGVLSYTSKGANEPSITAGVHIPDLAAGAIDAKAKVTIKFASEHGIIFRASGIRFLTMRDQPQMARKVAGLAKSGQWGRDWYIVTQAIQAASASILISNSASAEVELALGANATVAGIELLGAELRPRVVRQKDMHFLIVGEGGLTPLFKAKRVKRTMFGNVKLKAGFGPADVSGIEDMDDASFEREFLEEVDIVDQIVPGEAADD